MLHCISKTCVPRQTDQTPHRVLIKGDFATETFMPDDSSSMAIMRAGRHLASSSLAPPPSPIPTAKGSRSAAVDDEILSDYLGKSLQIPDLTLPKSHFAANIHRLIPEDIDFGSVKARDSDSIRRLLRSVKEFGVFRISGVGVSADEVGSTVTEAESIFRASEEDERRKFHFRRDYDEAIGNKEEFVWLRSEEMVEWVKEAIGCERYHNFSEKMERISSKLHEVAEEVGLVFSENKSGEAQGRLIPIPEMESVLSLYRYSHDSLSERNSESSYHIHALTLHLPIQHSEFRIQSHQGLLSFHACPGSVVATIGQQLLQEWSQGELKSVSSEFLFDSELHGRQASFSIVLKCSPLNLNHGLHKTSKVISISDQFLIAFILIISYKVIMFLFS